MSRELAVAQDADGDEKGSRRPNPIDVHVGSRVRFRRMLLGMSQEKLAEKLGLTFQQIQKYEKGINRIGASRLFDLATVLAVPVQFFYEEVPSNGAAATAIVPNGFAESGPETSIVEFLKSRDGLELNKAFVRIHDVKARRAIVDLVRSLANVEPLEEPAASR
jgi:transcriptional regulator with XRE-family HTH domain